MALETATYIDALVTSNPDGADARSTADDHLRLIKAVLKRSFPMVGGAVSASAKALCYVNDLSASAQAQLNALRDGSATARFALVASTAVSASSAAALAGVPAANIPVLSSANIFSNSQRIDAPSYHLSFFETDGPDPLDRVLIEVSNGNFYIEGWDNSSAAWTSVLIYNLSTGALAFGGTSITWNGYNLINPIQMNSVPAASYARLDNAQTFGKGTGSTVVQITPASSISPNMADGNVHRCVLNQSMTILAPTAPRSGQTLVLILRQSTGGHTAAWNSIYKFPSGVDPTLSTAAGACDVFAFVYDDLSAAWVASGLNVS